MGFAASTAVMVEVDIDEAFANVTIVDVDCKEVHR